MRKVLDTLLTWLRQWESDKWIHVVAFLLLAWLVARLLVCCDGLAAHGGTIATLIGAGVSALMAIGKEVYDKKTEGLFDWQDLWASWLGIGLFVMMALL